MSTNKQPSHELFAVAESTSGGKAFWTKIGTAWPTKDGQGFSLKLDLVPIAGQSLQLRQHEPKPVKEA